MDARKYLAELVGTFLFLTIGYAVGRRLPRPRDVPTRICSSSRSRSASACWPRSSPSVTSRAATSTRPSRSRPSSTSGPTTTDAVGYILAQVIGAIGAAAVVFVVSGQDAVAAGVTKPGGGVTDIGALILEIVLTAGFVLVILVSTKRAAGLWPPLAIPLTLVAIHFAVGDPVRRVGQSGPIDRVGAASAATSPDSGST